MTEHHVAPLLAIACEGLVLVVQITSLLYYKVLPGLGGMVNDAIVVNTKISDDIVKKLQLQLDVC